MTLPKNTSDREYQKFVETDDGSVAVRVVGSSGSTQLDVNAASVESSALIGKASGTNADFTTAYASGTTITVSGLPAYVSSLTANDLVSIEQYTSAGVQVERYTRDDAAITMSGSTITVAGASFGATDVFVVYTNIPRKITDNMTVPVAEYISPTDFTVTYTSASTVTLTGLPFTLSTAAQIVYVKVRNSSTNVTKTYINGANNYAFAHSSGVVTAYLSGSATSIFTSNDMYEMGINGPKKTYDSSLDVAKVINQSPDRLSYVADSILDTTNIAAATNYYPSSTGMSMDGYKDMSLTGKFIDADGTMTLTVEVTNDEDTTNGDWIQIYGYDSKNNTTANSWSVTNGTLTFAVDFDNLNYSYYRIKMVNDGATNTGIIKMRRKSL